MLYDNGDDSIDYDDDDGYNTEADSTACIESGGFEDDDDYADDSCPACAGPPVVLGDLGAVTWCRCRNCGLQYHAPV